MIDFKALAAGLLAAALMAFGAHAAHKEAKAGSEGAGATRPAAASASAR